MLLLMQVTNEKSKLETLKFYNFTKFGVDVLHQIARKYTVNAASRMWPVQFFLQHIRFVWNQCPHFIKLVFGSKISRPKYICGYPKSFVRNLLKKEKLTHTNPVKPTAVCRKARSESTAKAKAASTKHVKHAAVDLSLFVVNALKNSFIVGFAANKYWL